MVTLTTNPDDPKFVDGPNAIEREDLETILRAVRVVRESGGWGRLVITFKGSQINEIETSYTKKVKPA